MARQTPSAQRWTPAATVAGDERQSLLRRSTEERVGAHEVTSSAQEGQDYPVDHGRVAWMQVLGGFIIFANSWYGTRTRGFS
jgi:hypothetical protein